MSQGAIGKIFGGRKCMLHRVSFLLHRAKEILYKKEGERVKFRNTVPVLVNYSCSDRGFLAYFWMLNSTKTLEWKLVTKRVNYSFLIIALQVCVAILVCNLSDYG